MKLVDYKYVYCPKILKEIRLKRSYMRNRDGQAGKKSLVDCLGARDCGASVVAKGKVVNDFSHCPFDGVRFLEKRP